MFHYVLYLTFTSPMKKSPGFPSPMKFLQPSGWKLFVRCVCGCGGGNFPTLIEILYLGWRGEVPRFEIRVVVVLGSMHTISTLSLEMVLIPLVGLKFIEINDRIFGKERMGTSVS